MRRHEQTVSIQKTFARQVSYLTEVIAYMGNPFIKESLDTRDIMDEEAAKSVRRAEELGVQQYEAFDEGRPVNCRKPLSDLTRKNKLQLFGQPQQETNASPSYSPLRVTAHSFPDYILPVSLEMVIFMTSSHMRTRGARLQDGKLLQGKKSDLLHCLISSVECCSDAFGF